MPSHRGLWKCLFAHLGSRPVAWARCQVAVPRALRCSCRRRCGGITCTWAGNTGQAETRSGFGRQTGTLYVPFFFYPRPGQLLWRACLPGLPPPGLFISCYPELSDSSHAGPTAGASLPVRLWVSPKGPLVHKALASSFVHWRCSKALLASLL